MKVQKVVIKMHTARDLKGAMRKNSQRKMKRDTIRKTAVL